MKAYVDPWIVVDTPCHPSRWKVEPQHTYAIRNDASNFFDCPIEAQLEANERNETHRRRHVDDCKRLWGSARVSGTEGG